jgi:hypothetical protein
MLNLYAAQPQPAARLPRVDVIIGRGVAQQRVRTVTPPVFVIGTNPECDLVLTDEQFADHYAYIMVSEDRVMLRHLCVSPEITVNRRLVRWSELVHGDRLRMGPYEFWLRIWPIGTAQIGDNAVELPRRHVDQHLGNYEPPSALNWTNDPGLSDSWAHVLPTVNRFTDW